MSATGDSVILRKGEGGKLAGLLLPARPRARLNSMSPSTRTQFNFFSQPVVVNAAGRGQEEELVRIEASKPPTLKPSTSISAHKTVFRIEPYSKPRAI